MMWKKIKRWVLKIGLIASAIFAVKNRRDTNQNIEEEDSKIKGIEHQIEVNREEHQVIINQTKKSRQNYKNYTAEIKDDINIKKEDINKKEEKLQRKEDKHNEDQSKQKNKSADDAYNSILTFIDDDCKSK